MPDNSVSFRILEKGALEKRGRVDPLTNKKRGHTNVHFKRVCIVVLDLYTYLTLNIQTNGIIFILFSHVIMKIRPVTNF